MLSYLVTQTDTDTDTENTDRFLSTLSNIGQKLEMEHYETMIYTCVDSWRPYKTYIQYVDNI